MTQIGIHTPARVGVRSATAWQLWTRRRVLARLARLRAGTVRIHERFSGVTHRLGGADPTLPVEVRMEVDDPALYPAMAARGALGAAESYVAGHWRTSDLAGLMRIMVRNRDVLDGIERGLARLSAPALRLLHRLNDNTPAGSRRNIAAHYDLGNEFFALFLDDTLTYSSGLFEHPGATMREASVAKLDRLCRKLDLQPGDHLLEIGTGWGSLAIHAARTYGCRVTSTTISKEQHALATERVGRAGLADRVTLLLEDYRDLTGRFDKLVSIEMVEAVGHKFLDTWLAQCSRLLAPDGLMAMQAITMQDQHYARALRKVDFIKRYIFPGSFIPSTTAISEAMARSTDLRMTHLEDMAPHYARTLRLWRERMFENLDAMRRLGLSDGFLRMWEYYLAYCEGGFAERFLGVAQIVLSKPLSRRAPILPPLDAAG